jgi:hypothetical protein
MVIHTEYRGQRYSMGSSYPLPPGFEIRFGSLNFQATGNGYLMRITNRVERHPWRSTRPRLVPATPAVGVPALAPPGAASPSAPRHRRRSGQRSRRRKRNDVGPRALRHDATHPSTQQRWRKGSPTGSVTPQPPTPRPEAPTLRRTTTSPATTSWRPETSSPLTTSRTMAPTASCPPRPRMGTWNGIFPACRIR